MLIAAALMAVDKHLIRSGAVKDCVEALEHLGGEKGLHSDGSRHT